MSFLFDKTSHYFIIMLSVLKGILLKFCRTAFFFFSKFLQHTTYWLNLFQIIIHYCTYILNSRKKKKHYKCFLLPVVKNQTTIEALTNQHLIKNKNLFRTLCTNKFFLNLKLDSYTNLMSKRLMRGSSPNLLALKLLSYHYNHRDIQKSASCF